MQKERYSDCVKRTICDPQINKGVVSLETRGFCQFGDGFIDVFNFSLTWSFFCSGVNVPIHEFPGL